MTVAELIDQYHAAAFEAGRLSNDPAAGSPAGCAAAWAAVDGLWNRLGAALERSGPLRHGSRVYWAFVHGGVGRSVVWKEWEHDAADVVEPATPTAEGGK